MNPFMKTLKKIAAAYNGVSLILRIAIGLVVGVILALVCPGATWLQELGNLFVGALKGIAPVLVFVIVASALAQGSSKLDRRFGTVMWLYMLTTFVAAALSVVTSMLFPQMLLLPEAAEAEVIPQGLGEVMHTLLSNIVSNPISAIMNGSSFFEHELNVSAATENASANLKRVDFFISYLFLRFCYTLYRAKDNTKS